MRRLPDWTVVKASALEAAMLELLDARGTATACPSEVARKVGGARWRALMPEVRAAAIRLQQRGELDVYQRGRAVDLRDARGPVRLRTRAVHVDHRAHPKRYVIGRGEQGVLTVEPYKSELLPLWRSGRKYDGRRRLRPVEHDPVKAAAAEEFRVYYERARSHPRYRALRAAFDRA